MTDKNREIEEVAKILCGMKNGCDGCMWDKVHCNERNYAEEIYNIISSREHNRKTTIISSESTIEEIFEIDEATAGRIKQNCGLYCIDILKGEGKNYRKENF